MDKKPDAKAPEVKGAENKAEKASDSKTSEKKEEKKSETKTAETKSSEVKITETKSAEVKPTDTKTADPKVEALSAEEKQKLLELTQLSLWIDEYDDIFSDFDPRSYQQRALSDDFLSEAKKVSKERPSGATELKLLVPESKRNPSHETVIRKRLRDHFKLQQILLEKEVKSVIQRGAFFAITGLVLMIATTYILFTFEEKNLIVSFLITLFEPASWFLFWEGAGLILFEAKEKKPELEFYEKLVKCEIKFFPY
ncbi:hypothetical protein HY837_00765 [archaeon]|nr:hypothetical protein [archaeon]